VTPKIVGVVQSSYIPWKGYFDLIGRADEFILYDDRQYTRRDWRNRNRIKTRLGTQWLTIPVQVRGRYLQRIDETLVSDPEWAMRHWETLRHAYAAAPHFGAYAPQLETLYGELESEPRLSVINRRFLELICKLLGIETPISWSTDYAVSGGRTERLVSLCRAAGATTYLSGPSARAYLDESLFEAAAIDVEYMDYGGYLEYPQLHPPFEHRVSVLDLLFSVGDDAPEYLKNAAQPRRSPGRSPS
jgi:hypothetical protein